MKYCFLNGVTNKKAGREIVERNGENDPQEDEQSTAAFFQEENAEENVMRVGQRTDNNKYVIDNASFLNKLGSGKEKDLVIRSDEINFSFNAFMVNDKNILDAMLHKNCHRYHIRTVGQTNTPRIKIQF